MNPLVLATMLVIFAASPLAAGEGKEIGFITRGSEYLEAQDYQRAVKAFAQAVDLNPDHLEAQKGLARAYLKLGDGDAATNIEMVENAVSAFKEVLRLEPRSSEVRYQLGLCYLLLNDPKSAGKELDELKSLDAAMAKKLREKIASYRAPKAIDTMVPPAPDRPTTQISLAGNHVLVPVSLSHAGTTVQATLVLDTGATSTLISKSMANRLNIDLERATRTRFQVVGGGLVQGWRAKLDQVRVGPQKKEGVEVAVVDNGAFPYDGLLGMNFLRSFRYSIDFNKKELNWLH